MQFVDNDCCGTYALSDVALDRLNSLRKKKNQPSLDSKDHKFHEKCKSLRDDPDFIEVVREFKGRTLKFCHLTIIDVTNEKNLHELFKQRKFDEISQIIGS